MTDVWGCPSSSDFSSPEIAESLALVIVVPFGGDLYRATVSGTSLLWQRDPGGGFVTINTYDLQASATDTLGELASVMTSDAPTLVFLSVISPFGPSDASTVLVDGMTTASLGSNGGLFGSVA